jgi:hypothetical protein
MNQDTQEIINILEVFGIRKMGDHTRQGDTDHPADSEESEGRA